MRPFALGIGISCVVLACSGEPADPGSGDQTAPSALVVHATSYPLAFFSERIGGAELEVRFAVPPDVDPAHWNPDPETIAQAQRADLLLRHGAGDPIWLDLASLHANRVVDTTAGVRDRLIEQQSVRHQHGPDGDHSHGTWENTTWLDPSLAASEAEAIAEALAARRPELADEFRANLEVLRRELEALDAAQERATDRLRGVPLLYSHPVYAYFDARYDLNGRSVVWEPDELPSEAQWRALRETLEQHPADTMLWEAEPLPEIVERLASLGVESHVYAPCSNRPDTGDWMTVMHENVRMLETLQPASR